MFKVGDICILVDNKKSRLSFKIGSIVEIVSLKHRHVSNGHTVKAISDEHWFNTEGYCYPEEIRLLTPLDKAML